MKAFPIGSITILTNVTREQEPFIDYHLKDEISTEILAWVKSELFRRNLQNKVIITSYESRSGCVLTIITLALTVTGIASLKDFKDFKESIIELISDISKLWAVIFHKKRPTDKEKKVLLELPKEIQELYKSGEKLLIKIDKETLTIHKIVVMREDLTEEFTTETITRNAITIRKGSSESENETYSD